MMKRVREMEDSSIGKASIGKGGGGGGEGELSELMAALESENQLARDYSNAQVSRVSFFVV